MNKKPNKGSYNVFGHDLKLLVPAALSHTYLNTGTLGPTPTSVLAATTAQELEWEEVGPGHVPFYLGAREEARKFARRLEQNFPGGTVSLTENNSAGILKVLWGIDFHPGDEIITTDQEHGAVLYAISAVARRFGLRIKVASLGHETGIVRAVKELLTPKTRLVILSHVSHVTGWELPVSAIAEEIGRFPRCRYLVDGAQALGNIVVDPSTTGADFYVFCGHKWMMAPAGWAGLWVRKGRLPDLFTAWAEEGPMHVDTLTERPFDPDVEYGTALEFGTRSWPRVIGWALTWDYYEEEGFLHQATYQRGLAEQARSRLQAIPDLALLQPPDPMMKNTALMTVISNSRGSSIAEQLWQKHVYVKPVPEQNAMRIAWALFNTEEDLEALVSAIDRL